MSTEPQQDFVPCCHHPETPATQNCMGCGNPLCMECVRASGYYCSEACKQSVRATEPDAVSETEAGYTEVDQRVEQTMAAAGSFVGKLKWPVIVLVIGIVAVWVYRNYFGPEGEVVATMEFESLDEQFSAHDAGGGQVLLQANDDLILVNPLTGDTAWSVGVAALEMESRRASDRLPTHLVALGDQIILMRSGAKLIGLERASGEVAWSRIETNSYLRTLEFHEQGIVCGGWNTLQCLAPTDGAVLWTTTNQLWTAAEFAVAGNDLLLAYRAPAPPAETDTAQPEEETLTAGGGFKIDARSILAAARGEELPEPETEPEEYLLEFVGLATGISRGQISLQFPDVPDLHVLAGTPYAFAGRRLVAFSPDRTVLWEQTLPAEIQSLTGDDRVLAVATETAVVLLDSKTGKQNWAREDLEPLDLVIGPDNAVYATVSMPQKTAAEFRAARVADSGSSMPYEHVKVLLRLDPSTGEPEWGVRQIGDRIIFDGDRVLVFDSTHQVDLLADSGLFSGYYSVRQLNPSNGRDIWVCVQEGLMFDQWVSAGQICLVTAINPSQGRFNPRNTYRLQVVEPR